MLTEMQPMPVVFCLSVSLNYFVAFTLNSVTQQLGCSALFSGL